MAQAHIFPRALVHDMKNGDKVVHGVSLGTRGLTNYQSGPWEPDILCQRCEGKLADCDNYAIKWIRRFEKKAISVFNGKGFEVPNPKPKLLVKFAASVLWRAAVAKNLAHPDVDLGPWEPMLRDAIFAPNRFQPSVFVARKRYVSEGVSHGSIIVHPYRARGWSKRSYVFEIGDFLWGLKLDDGRGAEKLFEGHIRANEKETLIVVNLGDQELAKQHDLMAIFAAAEGLG